MPAKNISKVSCNELDSPLRPFWLKCLINSAPVFSTCEYTPEGKGTREKELKYEKKKVNKNRETLDRELHKRS